MHESTELKPASRPPTLQRPLLLAAGILLLVGVLTSAWFYWYVVSGGLRARQPPSQFEASVARHLVDLSIPAAAKQRSSPIDANAAAAAVAGGRELFQKNCEQCHGYDGSGKTAAGGGLYPPPSELSRLALDLRNRTDGDLFYLIQNGVRNTGMPGWQLPDQQIWQLVAFIRSLPGSAARIAQIPVRDPKATYVGSASCKNCHQDIYERWHKTPMANVIRDPKEHPDAILPDLSKSDPLVKFTAADIAFVYGSRWKQRYFKKVGDDYFPLPAQWDVTHKQWRPYFVKDDWWAPLYPPDNLLRPTGPLCDGCHSVNYNIATKTVTEWNVGCEKCHGPGSEHAKHPMSANIVNPARQAFVAASDVCIQCHSQGRPPGNPIAGKHYDWPVGYDPYGKLSDFWKLEEHKLGTASFTHFADGTAHKNRMQGNDYVTSQMYTHGVTCSSCHDPHGTPNSASLRKPAQALCLDCHGSNSPNGPRAVSLAAHTHHKADGPGSECIACHMPQIAQTIGDVNVRSHTFRFVSPAMTDSLKTPNACNQCHTNKTTAWASQALNSWTNQSPWRMAE